MSGLAFDKLTSRWRISGEVVAVTGLRIGAGKGFSAAATNLPLLRDANGEPYLPGSSLKGALRSGLERILRGIDRRPALWACDLFVAPCAPSSRLEDGKRHKLDYSLAELGQLLCPACRLFGSPQLAGRIFLRDLRRLGGGHAELRDGVGIDRDLGVAASGVKYDLEVMPAGSRFELALLLENADETQLALVLAALDLLHQGEIRLGGMSSRGLGQVALDGLTLGRTDASRLLSAAREQDRYEQRVFSTELDKAHRHLAALAAAEEVA